MYRRRAESDIYISFNYRFTRIRASSSVGCNIWYRMMADVSLGWNDGIEYRASNNLTSLPQPRDIRDSDSVKMKYEYSYAWLTYSRTHSFFLPITYSVKYS